MRRLMFIVSILLMGYIVQGQNNKEWILYNDINALTANSWIMRTSALDSILLSRGFDLIKKEDKSETWNSGKIAICISDNPSIGVHGITISTTEINYYNELRRQVIEMCKKSSIILDGRSIEIFKIPFGDCYFGFYIFTAGLNKTYLIDKVIRYKQTIDKSTQETNIQLL